MKRVLVFLAAVIGFSGLVMAERGVSVAAKERRIALVIGNSDYKIGRLKNPVNDAGDMAGVLKERGFQVTLLRNASQRRMEKAIGTFGKDLRLGGVGLFFFAGHGMQVDGANYLIPIGANIEAEEDIRFESVDANRILAKMEKAGNRLNIVFLDACRNNPFARSFRSANKGLAVMDAPSGSLISFATAPGRTASDGDGRNGLFTGYLLEYMNQPGLSLTAMMMEVRKKVLRDSDRKQTPWDVSSLTGDFYFSGGGTAGATVASVSTRPKPASPKKRKRRPSSEETELWNLVGNSTVDELEAYLAEYPNG
ncbi:MAG: caspase family protein, partial [Proteobacteria bacterium]|nr:caspase family protein [Pseudomonadota bacterium]